MAPGPDAPRHWPPSGERQARPYSECAGARERAQAPAPRRHGEPARRRPNRRTGRAKAPRTGRAKAPRTGRAKAPRTGRALGSANEAKRPAPTPGGSASPGVGEATPHRAPSVPRDGGLARSLSGLNHPRVRRRAGLAIGTARPSATPSTRQSPLPVPWRPHDDGRTYQADQRAVSCMTSATSGRALVCEAPIV
jgi:hypothetical protein